MINCLGLVSVASKMPVINLSLNRSQSVAQIHSSRPKIISENRRQRSVTISEDKTKFYSDEDDNDNTFGTLRFMSLFYFLHVQYIPKQKFCKQKKPGEIEEGIEK